MMDPYLYRQGQCNETAGFLFSHPCSEPSDHLCAQCQKPICGKHAVDSGGVIRCTTCMKTHLKSTRGAAPGVTGSQFGPDPYLHSPYFYTWSHFGSSHHHHHFHDGDEGALRGGEASPEDLDGFERDMGAS